MNYDKILSILGLSQTQTETMVAISMIMIAVGFIIVFFWKYIIAGALILSVLSVFMHGTVASNESDPVVAVSKKDSKHNNTYMDDCVALTGKSDVCEEVVDERHVILNEAPVEVKKAVKLLDVDNQEYKERRADALKKPNAVIMQTTFSDHDR